MKTKVLKKEENIEILLSSNKHISMCSRFIQLELPVNHCNHIFKLFDKLKEIHVSCIQ